ncbi:uncharacterized protein RCC_09577 [Ramularia collo-cygni]|uniref:Amidase domain-containing protein n=1 Tax=Ramularia collo-cygni TaxID=112498 RepID=A0A2D3VFE6_9PEZI|nr:uncharacterized protein RCC_09577 [Ramularia collo-cygni]CZT23862.1 uncharacterized protein RCC_09577 [Ramularia collo-cygni]
MEDDLHVQIGDPLPLFGVPYAVEENIDAAGSDTTTACPIHSQHHVHAGTIVVARITACGAVVVGQTNLGQFATGLVGTRSPCQFIRNSLDSGLHPGGRRIQLPARLEGDSTEAYSRQCP